MWWEELIALVLLGYYVWLNVLCDLECVVDLFYEENFIDCLFRCLTGDKLGVTLNTLFTFTIRTILSPVSSGQYKWLSLPFILTTPL